MVFDGGVKAAAKMLAGLSKAARDKVLETISKKDPQMANIISKNMFTFEDLEKMTPLMVVELMRSIKVSDMGLALRIASPELKNLILSNSPKLIRQELEEILLGPPKLTSQVEEAQERIMETVLKKIEKGELVLSSESKEKVIL